MFLSLHESGLVVQGSGRDPAVASWVLDPGTILFTFHFMFFIEPFFNYLWV